MKFDIVTIFPKFFESFKTEALISRAQKKELVSINIHNLRDYADDTRGTVDDRPYGGGAGMVLMFPPIYKAVEKISAQGGPASGGKSKKSKTKVIVFNPKGKKFTQAMAREWSKLDRLVMICGRYEGIDERVMTEIADEEISIGDYVLFGGEVPAMVVMEAVTRLLPGAIGKQESLKDESFNDAGEMGKEQLTKFIEYPHYTRPEVVVVKRKKIKVPDILLSGDHKKIEEWRKEQSK
ncbi:MAG: tRNA (guanosine(37)-N1)-methyltransferase TrmD [Candidatus Magasanikbacteria bacterium]|nr:tRNA (guanosine(37)-N1)-methyltransferase TrmD [Candidatus Magasanikbacteria bacterium]